MVKRRFSNIELANTGNDPFLYSIVPTWGKIRLSSKDRFLVEQGGSHAKSLDLYLDLFTDTQAYHAWDRQMSEITSREFLVEAGGENPIDIEAADYVRKMLNELASHEEDISKDELAIVGNSTGFDGLTRGLGVALMTGISFAEIIWKQDEKFLPTVSAVKIRDPRRFHFDLREDNKTYLKLLTRNHSFDGIYVPARKFIVCRYWSIPNDDPYGNGLGRLLFYPVTWKRELLTLWLKIVDKHADPTVIGKYEEDVDDDVADEFERDLSNITRDMTMTMPAHFSVEFLTPDLSAPEMLSELEKLCNGYINKVISGEANTGEQGGGGVMRENISNSIRIMKAKAFSDLISETINNTLIKWLVNGRFHGAAALPRVWRNFDDMSETIELLTKMKGLGFRTNADFITNLTGIPLETQAPSKSFV